MALKEIQRLTRAGKSIQCFRVSRPQAPHRWYSLLRTENDKGGPTATRDQYLQRTMLRRNTVQ